MRCGLKQCLAVKSQRMFCKSQVGLCENMQKWEETPLWSEMVKSLSMRGGDGMFWGLTTVLEVGVCENMCQHSISNGTVRKYTKMQRMGVARPAMRLDENGTQQ